MTHRRLILIAACLALVPIQAMAAAADQAARRWKLSDACIADANKQVPDHNEAALRKRDALVDKCLKAHNLPPHSGLAPPEPKPAAPAGAPPS